eukprot:EC715874.1.p1 GENE.EC715874.1~~EC715874.1.p1  ORF type:complete len:91 (+),score=7.86 EC715874.1:390-662(+)
MDWDVGALTIFDGLDITPNAWARTVTSLKLRVDGVMAMESARAFAVALPQLRNLQRLNFGVHEIGDDAIQAVAGTLRSLTALTELKLSVH